MWVRRISLANLALVWLPWVLACPGVVEAQLPGIDDSRPDQTPEEMVQEALDKIETGDFTQASELLQKAKLLKPTLDKLNLVEGLLLIEFKPPRYPEAIHRLEAYNNSAEGRNDYRGFAAVGTIYKNSRIYRQAIRPLDRAKGLAPAEERGKPIRANITMDLAFAYLGLQKRKEALAAAKEAEVAAPNAPEIQFHLAQIAVQTEDLTTAETAVKRATNLLRAEISGDLFDKEAHDTLKRCYQLLTRLKQIDLKATPDDGMLHHALATVALEAAELERRIGLLTAREHALRAIEKEPKKHEWQVFAARLEVDLGANHEAMVRLEEVLEGDPGNQEAAKLLASIRSRSGKVAHP